MIKKLLFFTCFFSSVSLMGQDSTIFKSKYLIDFYSGYSKHIIKDDIISPLKYKGSKMPIGLGLTYMGHTSLQNLSLFYDNLILKSSISNSSFSPYTNNLNASIGYSYDRKVYTISKINTDLYFGGKLNWEINYREHFYNNYFNEFSGEQITSIGLHLFISKNFLSSDDKIYLELNIPVLAYTAFNNRYNAVVGEATENLNNDENSYWQLMKNGQFNTLNTFQEFQSILCYTKFVSKSIGLQLKYQLHFYNLEQYKDTFYARHLNSQFNIGLIIKLESK